MRRCQESNPGPQSPQPCMMPPSLRGYFHTDRNLFKKKWKEDTDRTCKRQEKPYLQGRGLEICVKPELGIEPETSDPRHRRTTPTPPHFLKVRWTKNLSARDQSWVACQLILSLN